MKIPVAPAMPLKRNDHGDEREPQGDAKQQDRRKSAIPDRHGGRSRQQRQKRNILPGNEPQEVEEAWLERYRPAARRTLVEIRSNKLAFGG